MAKDLQKLQNQIKTFCRENNISCSSEHRALDLVSEIGEISKEILKMTNYGKKPLEINQDIRLELGDALFSLIELANTLDINLEEAFNSAIQKYQNRIQNGTVGSEKDKINKD